jgi:hypothetical protein
VIVLEILGSFFAKIFLYFINSMLILAPVCYFFPSALLVAVAIFIGLFFIKNKKIHMLITAINVLILIILGFTHSPIFGWASLFLGALGALVLIDIPKREEITSWECPNCKKMLKNHEIRFGLCTFCGAKMNRSSW